MAVEVSLLAILAWNRLSGNKVVDNVSWMPAAPVETYLHKCYWKDSALIKQVSSDLANCSRVIITSWNDV